MVLDAQGRLAAATSTAGVFGKMPGRVGDTPIPAAGTWADDHAAVSCTGQGEYFIRTAAAAQTAWRVAANQPLASAARAVIDQIGAMGGDGGLIALDRHGNRADPFNSQGMKRAWLDVSGRDRGGGVRVGRDSSLGARPPHHKHQPTRIDGDADDGQRDKQSQDLRLAHVRFATGEEDQDGAGQKSQFR